MPLHALENGIGCLALDERGYGFIAAIPVGIAARHDFPFFRNADKEGVVRAAGEEAGEFDSVDGDGERVAIAHPNARGHIGGAGRGLSERGKGNETD